MSCQPRLCHVHNPKLAQSTRPGSSTKPLKAVPATVRAYTVSTHSALPCTTVYRACMLCRPRFCHVYSLHSAHLTRPWPATEPHKHARNDHQRQCTHTPPARAISRTLTMSGCQQSETPVVFPTRRVRAPRMACTAGSLVRVNVSRAFRPFGALA